MVGRHIARRVRSSNNSRHTAEEAEALVVLCARKHRKRARLLTLISHHTRTKANHHLELTKRFEEGWSALALPVRLRCAVQCAVRCASGAPPVRLRCASGLRCAFGAPPLPPARLTHLATLRVRRGVRAARLSLTNSRSCGGGTHLSTSATTGTVCVLNQTMTAVMRAFRMCYCVRREVKHGGTTSEVTRNDFGGNTERLRR